MHLQQDILYEISLYLTTRDIFSFSFVSSYYYNNILHNRYIMITHVFTVKKDILNLKFITKLSYKILNLNISDCKNIIDTDFNYLINIYSLNMSNCSQNTITDKAFKYLRGIDRKS